MDNKYLLIGMMSLILFISGCIQTPEYIIDGDSVYVDDSNIYLKVTPHTIHHSDWVYLEFESKIFSGDIDFAFGFDTDNIKPLAIERYNPHEETVEQSYTCDYDFDYNATDFWCYIDSGNGTTTLFTHRYDRGNIETKTAYWNITINKEWSDWSGTFESIDYEFDGKNKWYYKQGQSIEADTTYKIRYYLDVHYNSKYSKYDLAIKPSSETIQEAIANGHFYYLDPWADYNLDDGLLAYYSFDANVDCGDLSSHGRNCTPQSSPSKTPALLNESYLYDSSSTDYLSIANEALTLTEFSICGWFNSTGSFDEQDIFSRGENAENGRCQFGLTQNGCFRLKTSSDTNRISFGLDTNSDTFKDITNTGTYDDANFHQVCGIYNGSGIQLYADGILVNETATSGTMTATYPSMIGRTAYAGDPHYFNGDIDEIGWWNKSLTASEVTALYNSGAGLMFSGGTESAMHIDDLQIEPTLVYTATGDLNCSAFIYNDNANNYNVTINFTNSTDFLSQDIQNDKVNGTYSSFNLTGHSYTVGEIINCTLFAVERDNASINLTSSVTVTVLDTTPTWSLNPNNQSVNHTNADRIILDYECTDPDGPVSYYITNLTANLDTPLEIDITDGDINGSVNINDSRIRAFDYNVTCLQGAENISQILNITVLNNLPTIPTILLPEDNWTIAGTSINLTCNGSTDIDDDVVYYEFWGNISTNYFDLLQNTTSSLYQWTGLIPGLDYNWHCAATDTVNASDFTTNRTITVINFTSCSGDTNLVFNFTYQDEDNGTALTETFKANFQVETEDGSVSEALFDLPANANHRICLYNNNQTLTINTGMIEYTLGSYDARNYYFYNAEISQNVTNNIILYSLSQDLASGISVQVQDESGSGLEEHIIYVERYNVETNTYKLIAMGKTGDDGKDTIFLRGGTTSTGDAWYRFKIYYQGELLHTTLPQKITSATLTIPIGLTEYQEHVEAIQDVEYTLTHNQTTRTFTSTFSTTSGLPKNFCLKVVEERPGMYIYTKYDQCINSASGVLTYTHDDTQFKYHAYAYSYASSKELLGTLTFERLTNNLGGTGIFISALIVIILVTVGTFSPVAAVILGVIGIIGSSAMGLITVSQATITAIITLAVLIIIKLGRGVQ